MTSHGGVREWMFSGLATEYALDQLEKSGLQVRADTDPAALQRVMPLEDFSLEVRGSAMQALPAYLAFFCLENSARELIAERMKEKHGIQWWDSKVSRTVRDKVAGRQDKEGENRWHVRRGAGQIFYTDFGDLKSIIQNNFEDFADLFPDVSWVVSRFTELEASRNIVAHNNLLEQREVDRIKMYLADWVRQVG